jgi:signal transduction histidine kinase/ActR/RegA family two-component response regulator
VTIPRAWRSLKTRVTFVTSAILLVGLWTLVLVESSTQLRNLRTLLGNHQSSVVEAIADQINVQIDERMQALEAVATRLSTRMNQPLEVLQADLEALPTLGILFNAGFYVTGTDGVATASVPLSAHRRGVNCLGRIHVYRALKENLSSVSDVVVGIALKVPVFAFGVPIHDPSGQVIGCLVGVTDLTKANFLDRVSQHKLGKTGGYLLVSRAQRIIVTATDKSRIMERLAGPGVSPSIDRFLSGWEGYDVLVNPLGVEVLVAVHQIPLAGWYLAAATPTAEAFQPVTDLQNRLLLLAVVLTLAAGLVNWFVLKRQLSPVESTIRTLSALTLASGPVQPLAVTRHDEVGELIESFNRLLRALEERERERRGYEAVVGRTQRLEALGLLASGIAHDFNNLLAAIFGSIELALMKDKEGPAAPYLTRTLGNLDRARSLTRQLLTFSRGGDPELKAGPLFPFVEETARFALSGSSVLCMVAADPDLWSCRFDRSQIGQVIDNLVINARQAMPSGGTLTLKASNVSDAQGQFVELSVADTGNGIAPDVVEHIFDPFFTTKPSGHGLGLTTCDSIVRKHGGTIEVESTPGSGTTFRVRLPAAQGADPLPDVAEPSLHRGTGTILVMDDEASVAEILEELLITYGYRVIRTESGEQAVAAFEHDQGSAREIVAILVDLTVPGGMGGIETLDRLRRISPTIPVVVVSGFSEAPVLANPTAHGFTAALHKPFDPADLRAVLARILSA